MAVVVELVSLVEDRVQKILLTVEYLVAPALKERTEKNKNQVRISLIDKF